MTKNRQFPVTFVLVLLVHLALIFVLLRTFVLNSDAQSAAPLVAAAKPFVNPNEVNWVDTNPALEQAVVTPPPSTPKERLPYSTSVDPDNDPESDIALPVRPPEPPPEPEPTPVPKLAATTPPTPKPEPTPPPKPKPAPVLAPADAPAPTPKPEPKPTLKPAPKPESKPVPALKPASPPPTPKPETKLSPAPAPNPTPPPEPEPELPKPDPTPTPPAPKETPPTPAPTDAPDTSSPPAATPAPAAAAGTPTVGPPDLGWYHQIIHDAFHKNWRQPQSLPTASNAFQTKAHISINRDGSIADARIIQTSGNELMDGSVQTAIESVTRIVPLPNTIPSDTYSVVINFQLD